jgi:hypothetical protein
VEEYKITIDGEIKSLVFMITVTKFKWWFPAKKGCAPLCLKIDDANPKKAELFNIEITLITMNNLKLFVVSI